MFQITEKFIKVVFKPKKNNKQIISLKFLKILLKCFKFLKKKLPFENYSKSTKLLKILSNFLKIR